MKLETFLAKFDQFADAPGAVAKMRELVLEFAVRGRLSAREEDDQGDEAWCDFAEELDQRTYSSDPGPLPPFEIPDEWRWVCLDEVAKPCGQKKPDEKFTYIDVGSIDNIRGEIKSELDTIEAAAAPSRARKLAQPGSVIYATVRPYLKNIAVIEKDFSPPAIISTAFAILHPLPFVESRFLFYWLRSSAFEREVSGYAKGVAYPAINDGDLKCCAVPLPPPVEQKRIVAKVDELMALCDRLEAQQQERETRHAALARASLARFADAPTPANLPFLFHPSYAIPPADFRKSILTLAVQGKLVPQNPNGVAVEDSVRAARKKAGLAVRALTELAFDETPFETPDSWRWVTVADVADTRLGKMLDKEKNRGEAHPYLRNTNVHWFRFELDSIKTMLFESSELDEYRVEVGDVLICEGGHGIARSAVWDGQIPGIMFQKALHRVRPLSCLNGHFLTFCLWVYERDEILQRYYTGAGIPHFTGKALARVTFPLPPLAEQRRIVAKVEQLMALADALETQLAASRATAANLLSALVAELTAGAERASSPDRKVIDLHASPEFIRALLAAEIVDRLHEDHTFGQTKLQKVIHLAEYLCELPEIDSRPARFARGPHDHDLIPEVEAKMAACEWFKAVPREGGQGLRYVPLVEAGKHRAWFEEQWPEKAAAIRRLIDTMKTWKTERCERFSTLYAAWNDLIHWGQPATDDAILREVLEHWHPRKQEIPRQNWVETLGWMRNHGHVPNGFGRATQPQPQPELLPH